jgi:hypothetical protein
VLADGAVRNGTVVDGSGAPVAAYLKFAPVVQRDAVVEAYAGTNGAYTCRLRDDTHDVIVIPERASGLAPRRFAWQPGTTQFVVDAAMDISGSVRVGAAGLAGANVQLTIDGVPTTIATTDMNGDFTVHGTVVSGALVVLEVTPPATRGLPRLTASSTALDLGMPLSIVYAAVAERDLAGTAVRRGGSALPNAAVSIVGTIPSSATVSTGGAPVSATGELRASAIADAAGVLPQLLAPGAQLSAVITPAPGDVALTSVNLTNTVPTTITAAAMLSVVTATQFPANTALAGVALDAVPAGDLALAGVPTVRATSNASGQISLSLAAGASYDLRFIDPQGRAAPLVRTNIAASSVGAVNVLKARTRVSALVSNGSQPIRGALVQVLCGSCTGLERSRPIAEGVTGIDGRFTLAVPDPSTP